MIKTQLRLDALNKIDTDLKAGYSEHELDRKFLEAVVGDSEEKSSEVK